FDNHFVSFTGLSRIFTPGDSGEPGPMSAQPEGSGEPPRSPRAVRAELIPDCSEALRPRVGSEDKSDIHCASSRKVTGENWFVASEGFERCLTASRTRRPTAPCAERESPPLALR